MTASLAGNHRCSPSDCFIPDYLRKTQCTAERCQLLVATASIEVGAPAFGKDADERLLPKTLIGARPTVSIFDTWANREQIRQAEANSVASMNFLRRLYYRTMAQRLAD